MFSLRCQFVEKVCIYKNRANSLIPLRTLCGLCVLAKPLGVLSRHPCRIPKPLPRGEGLCMLGWLCVLAKPLGIHARHPCRAECGAAALTLLGATLKARTLWLLAKSFARCKTIRASNAKHPFSKKLYRFIDSLSPQCFHCGVFAFEVALSWKLW